MNKRTLAILAAIGATTIYGINHSIAKEIMPTYVKPFGLIFIRVLGATILFWLASLWAPNEKIDRKDYMRFFYCALAGMSINMLMFFKGLSLSTPINSAIIITISPILVFVLSAIIFKERIKLLKYIGISLGLLGALLLILFSKEVRVDAPNIPLGNIMFVINGSAYAVYLILAKPLTQKYHAITLMKWLFLLAVFINLPVTFSEFLEVKWAQLPFTAIWRIVFVVLGTTFLTYLLNIFALKTLKPSSLSIFIYVQPLIGILFALVIGSDTMSVIKIGGASLIFIGVYLVLKKPKQNLKA